jgi:hypothetical protein
MGPYIMQFDYNAVRVIMNTFLSSRQNKMAMNYVVFPLTSYCHGLLLVAAYDGSVVSCKDDSWKASHLVFRYLV